MNILGTQYTLNRRAYEIYIAGCAGNPHCEGCHTPETWNFNQGTPFKDMFNDIKRDVNEFSGMINAIMIFGGEPLDQDISELTELLVWLRESFDKTIWIFTRYEYEEALERLPSLPELCDYIKCGAYIPYLATNNHFYYGIQLATSNQYIIKIDEAQAKKGISNEKD